MATDVVEQRQRAAAQPPRDRSIEARELQVIGTAYFDIQQHFRSEATSHHLKLLYNS